MPWTFSLHESPWVPLGKKATQRVSGEQPSNSLRDLPTQWREQNWNQNFSILVWPPPVTCHVTDHLQVHRQFFLGLKK